MNFSFSDWGSVASFAGLAVAVIGFGITIYNTTKTKSAAEAAAESAEKARKSLGKIDTVAALAAILKTMEQIKSLQSEKAWKILPHLYSTLCEQLASVQGSYFELSEGQHSQLSLSVKTFRDLEYIIDRGIENNENLNASKYNKMLSTQMDNLLNILMEIKGQIGRENDG